MLKLLVVVRGFYPDLSASGNLIYPLLMELSDDYSIDVLTLSDIESEDLVSGTINVVRKKREVLKFDRITSLICRNFSFPFYNRKLSNMVRSEINKAFSSNNYDFVMAVTHEEILALTESIVPKDNRICFLMEKLHETSKIRFIRRLQKISNIGLYRKIMNRMGKVFVLPIVSNIFNSYNLTGTIELEHSMVVDKTVESLIRDDDCVRFTYIGGFDRRQRNPWPVMTFISNLKFGLKFDVYGYGNAIDSKSKLPPRCDFHGSLGPEKNQMVMNETDILISIGNLETDIFPSKIFDYLSTGLPIIHFTQNNDDPYYQYLNGYSNAIIFSVDEILGDSERCNIEIIDFVARRKGFVSNYDETAKVFYKQTPMYSAQIMKNILV